MNSTNRNITGEAALSREATAPRSAAQPSNRFIGPRKTAVAALATALLLGATACGQSGAGAPAAGQGTTAAPAATTTASATASATASPTTSSTAGQASSSAAATTPAAPAPEKWQSYTSTDGKVSFDYPAGWTLATPAGLGAAPNIDVDVSDAAGMVVASLHYGPSGAGLGGACQNPVPYSVLDSMELSLPYNTAAADTITPRFAFRALLEAGRVTASYGIAGRVAGKDGKSCMFYNVVSGPAESPFYYFADAVQVNSGGTEQHGNRKGAKTFPSLEAAKAYMQTPEYVNAKRMITSLKISAG